jgi:predicted nucleic acid-binding protein
MKTLLMDSSSAILLFKVALMNILIENYEILISQTVYKELTIPGQRGYCEFIEYRQKNLITVSNNHGSKSIELPLRGGEMETILLYHNGMGDFIIIDDKKGVDYCKRNNIPFINALLVPKILFFSNLIERESYIEKKWHLIHLGRYSKRIIDLAGSISLKELLPFLP